MNTIDRRKFLKTTVLTPLQLKKNEKTALVTRCERSSISRLEKK